MHSSSDVQEAVSGTCTVSMNCRLQVSGAEKQCTTWHWNPPARPAQGNQTYVVPKPQGPGSTEAHRHHTAAQPIYHHKQLRRQKSNIIRYLKKIRVDSIVADIVYDIVCEGGGRCFLFLFKCYVIKLQNLGILIQVLCYKTTKSWDIAPKKMSVTKPILVNFLV